jgi:histidinol-phosphate aminotransferase
MEGQMMAEKSADQSDVYFRRLLRPNVLALEGYSPGPPPESEDMVILSANENGFGTPPAVLDALRGLFSEDARIHRYPDIHCDGLRAALSQKIGLPAERFIIGNGLDDIINMLALTFLGPGDEVIVPAATFTAYSSSAKMMGAVPVFIPMRADLSIDIGAIPDMVTSGTKMIYLCSPNNPTGAIIRRDEFDAFLDRISMLPTRPLVIVDHAYAEFVDSDDHIDAVKYLIDHNNVAVLKTFSKMSGLAGVRVGYMLAHPNIISYMYRVRQPYSVNSLAQAAAEADVTEASVSEFKESVKASIIKSRSQLEDFLSGNGVPFVRSYANFVYAFYGMPYAELADIAQDLRGRGVIVRALKYEHAPSGLRLTVGTPEENRKLISALKGVISERRR